ncbi:MAG: hypothetical protein QOE11_1964 [Solirubrobacteraceae bacterium]|jgi:hypothetical protein|nr:hypothetical protein [Solirubrobacteraceae bacterium]
MKRIPIIALLLLCWVLPATASAAGSKARIVVVGDVLVDRGVTSKDVYVANGDVTVRGTVDGDLVVADGDVTIRGRVTGTVVTAAGTAVLGRRAQVDGDVVWGNKRPQVAPGAKVGGKVKKIKATGIGTGARIAIWGAFTLSAFLLGLLLLLLFPRAAEGVGRSARAHTGRSALFGVLAFLLIPILGVVLLVTVIGIPLGIGLLLATLPLYGIAYVASAFVVGRLILKKSARILAFLVGLLILRALAFVPILGGIVWIVATVIGLGALLDAALRARR